MKAYTRNKAARAAKKLEIFLYSIIKQATDCPKRRHKWLITYRTDYEARRVSE